MEFPFPMSHRVCRQAPLSLKVHRSKPLIQLRETKPTRRLCKFILFAIAQRFNSFIFPVTFGLLLAYDLGHGLP